MTKLTLAIASYAKFAIAAIISLLHEKVQSFNNFLFQLKLCFVLLPRYVKKVNKIVAQQKLLEEKEFQKKVDELVAQQESIKKMNVANQL